MLIAAATILLDVLDCRGRPFAAVYEAWVAADESQLSRLPGASAVEQLAQTALHSMELAQQAMQDIADCILDWMSALHEEVVELQACLDKAQSNPKELLGVSPHEQNDTLSLT